MLHCLQTPENGPDLTVLERQKARLKWQQEQNSHQQGGFNDTHLSVLQFQGGLIENKSVISVKSDPEFETGRNYPLPVSGFGSGGGGSDLDSGNVSVETGVKEKTSGKKRKQADKAQSSKIVDGGEEVGEKKMRGGVEEDASKVSERENSGDNSREPQKTDYIHVRARRGQATDSHSLAERVRREKISERMKYLQELVPGCNKIIGKAGMLDEIINYVQSLQKQVEFLSMKLAAVNPRLDFNMDDFFHKEMSPSCTNSFSTIGMLSEMVNPAYIQLNSVQQVVSCVGLDMGMNPPEMTLERTTSTPVPVPGTFLESSCFPHGQPGFTWENDLQSIYNVAFNQGRTAVFPSQPFSGSMAGNNLKMEM